MESVKKVDLGTRLGSMVLDHFIMTLIAFIFALPMMIGLFATAFNTSHEQTNIQPFSGLLLYVGLIGFAFYFCKDCIQGRSLAKRITKLQVIDDATGQVASPFQCFVRNIFCVIWPIEVIVTLSNPTRRIGDLVARTRIERYDPQQIEQPKAFTSKLLIPLVLAFGLMYLFMLPIQLSALASPKVKYVESSYNPTVSKAIELLFSDSLGSYLSASVRVYDKVENEEVKYVSIIYTLKENYIEEDETRIELRKITQELLYSRLPKNTIIGQAKYVYRQPGFIQTTSDDIGRPVRER